MVAKCVIKNEGRPAKPPENVENDLIAENQRLRTELEYLKNASLVFGRRATPKQKAQVIQELRKEHDLKLLLEIGQGSRSFMHCDILWRRSALRMAPILSALVKSSVTQKHPLHWMSTAMSISSSEKSQSGTLSSSLCPRQRLKKASIRLPKKRRNPNKYRKFVLGFCWVFGSCEKSLQHFIYKNKRKACIQAKNA